MKKSILSFCAIAAALLLAGCQKENINVVETVEATHSVVFTAEKMVETKTAIASEDNGVVSYKWIEGDEERMYITETYISGEDTVVNEGTITAMALSNNDKVATFNVTFSGTAPTGTIRYRAAYSGHFTANKHNLTIPNEQAPLPDSFDPLADAMISNEIIQTSRDENPSFRFLMNRKVSVNKMTLKNLTPGEIITSVTFESDKVHAAYYDYGKFYGSPSADVYNAKGKKLTFTYNNSNNNSNNTVPASGEFPVYFTTAPVTDATFTVTVFTNQNRYRKTSGRPISFACGEVRRFGVDLKDCVQPEGRVFNLVTNANKLVLGYDVVIATNGSNPIAMSTVQNDNNRGATAAIKNSDYSTITTTEQVQVFRLVAGSETDTYAFSFVNSGTTNYLYAASSTKNHLKSKPTLDANGSWTIQISNKEATITAQGEYSHNLLRYNSGDNLFSCYASGQQTVYIYQAPALSAPEMSWSASSATASMTTGSGIIFNAPTLNLGHASSVSYQSSTPSVATIDENSGEITIVGAGNTTISAIFKGDNDYAPQTVTYTLTVADNREIVATPTFNPAAGEVDSGTNVAINCSTSGATIYYTTGTSDFSAGDWMEYTTSIVITTTCTIKVIATAPNYKNSDVATATYTISGATEGVCYTLNPVETGNGAPYNNYDTATTTTIDNIGWSVKGNSSLVPWRIGGKDLSRVDREIYSTTAMSDNITKIVITHGEAKNITINSMTVIVSKNANFSSPISTLTPTFAANSTVTITRPSDISDWSNCYFKFVYNVSVNGNKNKFIEFTEAEFYSIH